MKRNKVNIFKEQLYTSGKNIDPIESTVNLNAEHNRAGFVYTAAAEFVSFFSTCRDFISDFMCWAECDAALMLTSRTLAKNQHRRLKKKRKKRCRHQTHKVFTTEA